MQLATSYITKLKEKNFAPKEKVMKPCQTPSKQSTHERERKRNKGQGPKSRQANGQKEVGHNKEREPLSIKTPFTDCMKHISTKERKGR
jgi:hypothetical protein